MTSLISSNQIFKELVPILHKLFQISERKSNTIHFTKSLLAHYQNPMKSSQGKKKTIDHYLL